VTRTRRSTLDPDKELQMNAYPHHPTHWLGIAVVLALGLMAVEAIGQQSTNNLSPNASAVFQGRPAMSGAQAGLGALAGPPQGGIGLQGSEGAGLNLRRPRIIVTDGGAAAGGLRGLAADLSCGTASVPAAGP